MVNLYLATGSIHKSRELQELLLGTKLNLSVHTPEKIGGMPKVEETGSTLEDNARLKARALKAILPQNAWVLADDSGLFVDSLNGAPGVHSAIFAGTESNDENNRRKLLKLMENCDGDQRKARFLCCFVLLHSGSNEVIFLSSIRGIIAKKELGNQGFGYDSLFIPNGQKLTFAEMDATLKNQISHRGYAMRQLVDWLREFISN